MPKKKNSELNINIDSNVTTTTIVDDSKPKKRTYKKYDNDTLVKMIVNKQLKPFGVSVKHMLNVPDWFMHFEVTEEQDMKWMKSGVQFIRRHAKRSYMRTKRYAEKEMIWIHLMYGLKVGYGLVKRGLIIEKITKQKEENNNE